MVALVALAGTWGGPAVAAQLFTGKDVRNRSLTGRDLKSNSVTGRVIARLSGRDVIDDGLDGTDILERSLATVPRAGRADSAGTADTADSVGGLRLVRVAYTAPASAGATTVLDAAGLRLEASCASIGGLAVTATATGGAGFARVTGTRPDSRGGTAAVYTEDDELGQGEQFNVLAGGGDDTAGTLTWFGPAGEVVTLPFLAEGAIGGSRPFSCLFAGTATVAPGG